MLANPSTYLNGTAPLNTTGCVRSCIYQLNENLTDTGDCTIANGTDRDSFIWLAPFRFLEIIDVNVLTGIQV